MQQGRPGSRGDVFTVMAEQVCLSNGTEFGAGKSNCTIGKGEYVPTWHVACQMHWIYVKHHGGHGTRP